MIGADLSVPGCSDLDLTLRRPRLRALSTMFDRIPSAVSCCLLSCGGLAPRLRADVPHTLSQVEPARYSHQATLEPGSSSTALHPDGLPLALWAAPMHFEDGRDGGLLVTVANQGSEPLLLTWSHATLYKYFARFSGLKGLDDRDYRPVVLIEDGDCPTRPVLGPGEVWNLYIGAPSAVLWERRWSRSFDLYFRFYDFTRGPAVRHAHSERAHFEPLRRGRARHVAYNRNQLEDQGWCDVEDPAALYRSRRLPDDVDPGRWGAQPLFAYELHSDGSYEFVQMDGEECQTLLEHPRKRVLVEASPDSELRVENGLDSDKTKWNTADKMGEYVYPNHSVIESEFEHSGSISLQFLDYENRRQADAMPVAEAVSGAGALVYEESGTCVLSTPVLVRSLYYAAPAGDGHTRVVMFSMLTTPIQTESPVCSDVTPSRRSP